MSKEQLFHVGIKALIEDKEGKILLLKVEGNRYNKFIVHWDIPGGRIQQGGDVMDTLEREVEEETGVKKISRAKFFTSVISKHAFATHEGLQVKLVLMIYKVKIPDNSKITISDEHTAYEWVEKKEAAKRLENKYPTEFTELL